MESLKSLESEKEALSEFQEKVLKFFDFEDMRSFEKWVKRLEENAPGYEETKLLSKTLEKLKGRSSAQKESAEAKRPEITKDEADELLEAMLKKEAEPEYDPYLTPEDTKRMFEGEKEK